MITIQHLLFDHVVQESSEIQFIKSLMISLLVYKDSEDFM